jgi:nicotinate-nucleotide adenylyltransferase
MPVGQPPHKQLDEDPGGQTRLEMCRLAIAGGLHLEVSGLEVEREGPSYTYATLEQLAAEHPSDELTFILGADQAAALSSWREPRRILELARLGIADRVEIDRADVLATLQGLGTRDRGDFFDMPEIAISSTMVRERIRAGAPLHYLLPDAVAEFIESEGLYRS